MAKSGPLHPVRDSGDELDATFELTVTRIFDLVFHHKAGGRESPRSVNADYCEGLELLLARLCKAGCRILDISVDSSVALALPEEERKLALNFPIVVNDKTDPKRNCSSEFLVLPSSPVLRNRAKASIRPPANGEPAHC